MQVMTDGGAHNVWKLPNALGQRLALSVDPFITLVQTTYLCRLRLAGCLKLLRSQDLCCFVPRNNS